MRPTLAITLLLLTAAAVSGQTAKPAPSPTPEGGSKLERFQARAGAVLIKGYSVIGQLEGEGGIVSVESMEFTDAQSGRKEQGIVIVVNGSDKYARARNSFIDYDEIDSLVKGIEYIAKVDNTVTKQTNFEAAYHTRGDFTILTFNSMRNDSIRVAVSAGGIGSDTVFLRFEQLAELKELILKAKAKLDTPK